MTISLVAKFTRLFRDLFIDTLTRNIVRVDEQQSELNSDEFHGIYA